MAVEELMKRLHSTALELEPLRRQLDAEKCGREAAAVKSAQGNLMKAAHSLAKRAGMEKPVGPNQYRCSVCREVYDNYWGDDEQQGRYRGRDRKYVCEPCMRHMGY